MSLRTSRRPTGKGFEVTLGSPVMPPVGMTRAIYTVQVQLSDVIDLRDHATCALLGTNAKELAGAWRYRKDMKAPTQRLGRLAAKLGVEGLIFQSTKGSGACLVVFTANLRSPSFIEVSDGVKVLERMP